MTVTTPTDAGNTWGGDNLLHEGRRRPDKPIFYCYLALLIWAPIPTASYTTTTALFLAGSVLTISSWWLWLYARRQVEITSAFRSAWPALVLLFLWLGFVVLQIVPLPFEWLAAISPEAAYWHLESHQAAALDGQSIFAPPARAQNPTPLTATISVDWHTTTWSLLKSLSFVAMFCLTLVLVRNHARVRLLITVLVFCGVAQALYGSLMTLSGLEYGFFTKKLWHLGVATGTFWSRNHLAGYLEMCLALGTGLMIGSLEQRDEQTWRQRMRNTLLFLMSAKVRLRVYLIIMVIALVLTRSRMGNTAFFASLLVSGAIGLALSRHAPRSTVIFLVSVIVLDIFIVGAWFGIDKVAERIQQTSVEAESRDEVANYTISHWQNYPWTGSGLGSYYAVFPRYQGEEVTQFQRHGHNDYLQFGAETGIIGVALLGLTVVTSLATAIAAQYRRRDGLMRGVSFAAIMGIIALLIHSAVDLNLQIPANAMTFMVILALAWISNRLRSHR